MHREFLPQDMPPFESDSFALEAAPKSREFLGLYIFTALLGLLIGSDVALGALGWNGRLPLGISRSNPRLPTETVTAGNITLRVSFSMYHSFFRRS